MQRLCSKRRWPGWIAVVAVLGNVLAGTSCCATAQAADAFDGILAPHLMCAASEREIQAPGGGGEDPGGTSPHCAVCTLVLTGFAAIVALTSAAIVFSSMSAFYLPRFGLRTLADHLSLGGIRSRAPPLPA